MSIGYDASMRIGEFAEASGVPAKTIRYYESVGLLPQPRRLDNGYRDYVASAATRLEFIRSAQAIGLSLGEIRGVLDFRDRGNVPCTHVAELIDRRAREVSAQIAALERVRADLQRLARRARRLSPRDCEKASVCHIIES
jgi:DNA-binding transcriptional MerR regulator